MFFHTQIVRQDEDDVWPPPRDRRGGLQGGHQQGELQQTADHLHHCWLYAYCLELEVVDWAQTKQHVRYKWSSLLNTCDQKREEERGNWQNSDKRIKRWSGLNVIELCLCTFPTDECELYAQVDQSGMCQSDPLFLVLLYILRVAASLLYVLNY